MILEPFETEDVYISEVGGLLKKGGQTGAIAPVGRLFTALSRVSPLDKVPHASLDYAVQNWA